MAEIITIMKLHKLYGPHGADLLVMKDHLTPVERTKRGELRRYRLKQALPTKIAFDALLRDAYTSTVADLVSDAVSELIDLGSELGEWYDNLPEGLQQGDKGSTLEEGRSTLENLSEPDVPASVKDVKVFCPPPLRNQSRSDRCAFACVKLQLVIDQLEELTNGDTTELGDDLVDQAEDAQALMDECQLILDDAEGVEFPGMY
jgi:hypothetical protein